MPDDVGPHPPDRVGRKPHAAVRVELGDRIEQADIALLNQVEQVGGGPLVVARDHHHQAQVVSDQAPRRFAVLMFKPAQRQGVFVFARQHGDTANLGEVALQVVADRDERGLGDGSVLGFLRGLFRLARVGREGGRVLDDFDHFRHHFRFRGGSVVGLSGRHTPTHRLNRARGSSP